MSRSKARARRNRPVTPESLAQLAEERALRDRIMDRLDGLIEERVAQGVYRCPGCGRLDPHGTAYLCT